MKRQIKAAVLVVTVLFSAVFLLSACQNKTEENFLQNLQEAFKQNHRRNLEVLKQEDITVSGRPALFVSALVYSNNGDSMPISALIVPTQDGAVYYFVSSQLGAADQTKAEEMLKSVVFP